MSSEAAHTRTYIQKYWPQIMFILFAVMAYGEARINLSNVVDAMPNVVTKEKSLALEEKYKNRCDQMGREIKDLKAKLRTKAFRTELNKIEEVLENRIETNHRRQSKANERREKIDDRLRDVEKIVF